MLTAEEMDDEEGGEQDQLEGAHSAAPRRPVAAAGIGPSRGAAASISLLSQASIGARLAEDAGRMA